MTGFMGKGLREEAVGRRIEVLVEKEFLPAAHRFFPHCSQKHWSSRRRETRACEGLTTEGSLCHIALTILPKIPILFLSFPIQRM
jgi:hypothetical protein